MYKIVIETNSIVKIGMRYNIMLLSGCVIVKNEAALLDGCLKSLSKFVDELIVVDNGSTDDSVNVAKSYNATVINLPDANHDGGRNAYIQAAKGDWIVVLDADERILYDDGIKIRAALINSHEDLLLGYYLPRYDYLGNGKWAYIHLLRLFKRDNNVYYERINAHASVGESIADHNGTINILNVAIHHLDIILPQRTKYKRQRNIRRITAEINEAKRNNREYSVFLHCFLGLEYTAANRFDDAKLEYQKAIDSNDEEAIAEGKIFYAQTCLRIKDYITAKKYAIDVLHNHPIRYEKSLFILAEIAVCQERMEDAISIATIALQQYPQFAHWYVNLAFLLKDTNIEKSRQCIEKAIELNPFLLERIIYNPGEKPNIFEQQSSFLSITGNIFDILIRYYDVKKDYYNKAIWEKKYESTIPNSTGTDVSYIE